MRRLGVQLRRANWLPRIPSGIVRTLLESFNPFAHRSNPVLLGSNPLKWDRTLPKRFNPSSDCPDTQHERVQSLQNRVETRFWSQETLPGRVSGQQNWVWNL